MLGLTFRLLDGLDYYFVAINRVTGVYSAGLTQAGSQTVFCTNQMPSKTYNAGKFFALSVTMTSTGFVYYVSLTPLSDRSCSVL